MCKFNFLTISASVVCGAFLIFSLLRKNIFLLTMLQLHQNWLSVEVYVGGNDKINSLHGPLIQKMKKKQKNINN